MQALDIAAGKIADAEVPEDVFGALAGTALEEKLQELTTLYRKLVQVVHPDKYRQIEEQETARPAFVKITQFKVAAEAKLRAGTYGDRRVAVEPETAPAVHPVVIQTPKRKYLITRTFSHGDLADLYKATYGKSAEVVILKVAQSPADNDLMDVESRVLSAIYPPSQKEEKFYRYLPRLMDTFQMRSAKRTIRRVNVFPMYDDYYSLEEVLQAHPNGIDFRDWIWMYKRALAGIGYVHLKKDVVHGALTPAHVLIHPIGHGAKIVDWCYAVQEWSKGRNRIKAIQSKYKKLYPPEVLAKQPPTPATDLYMLSKCSVALLGGNTETNQVPDTVPKQIQSFLTSCLLSNPSRRPDNAWQLHEEFDELLLRTVGKPRYRPLSMPAR